MIKSLKINKKHSYAKRLHFKECSLTKFTILYGGNGVGKSTLLSLIQSHFNKPIPVVLETLSANDITKGYTSKPPKAEESNYEIELADKFENYIIHTYANGKDNDKHNNPSPFGDCTVYTTQLARRMHSQCISEGQGIIYSFGRRYYEIINDVRAKPDNYHVVILDEIDSGLSCDHVNVMMHLCSELLSHENVQIIVATNAYHWVHVYKVVLCMYTGKTREIDSYESFFKTIMDNQQRVGQKSDFNFL